MEALHDFVKNYLPSIELAIKSAFFIGILFIVYFIISNVSRYISWGISKQFPPEHQYIRRPLHQIVKIILFIPIAIGILWWWGVDVSHLVISAGLIGSVLLFILRDPIENTMSAFLLIVQYKLKHDQRITITGPGGNFSGKLIYLDLGHVFLEDKGEVYIIPNGTVSKSIIKLNSQDIKEVTSDFLKRIKEGKKLIKKLEKEGEDVIKDIEKI